MQGASNSPTTKEQRPCRISSSGAADQRISIDAPTDRVWSALGDFGGIDRWSPVINHSASVDGAERGVGAERACELKGLFPNVVERTTQWDEGRGYSFEIKGAPMLREALPAGRSNPRVTPRPSRRGWSTGRAWARSAR
jgi:hypothetical protein